MLSYPLLILTEYIVYLINIPNIYVDDEFCEQVVVAFCVGGEL